MSSDADVGRCDLCGDEDSPREPLWWKGSVAWLCPSCAEEADPVEAP